jgi:atypical dual specificity phosphatase
MLSEFHQLATARKARWASEILDNQLWLGNGQFASDASLLAEKGITYILNVADDVPNYHENVVEFHYCRLNVVDFGQDVGIARVFDIAFQFLQQAKDRNERVLVHCAAGANRSATIVIAWLMHSLELSLKDAFELAKRKRPGVSLLKDNRAELLGFELQIRGVNSFNSVEEF